MSLANALAFPCISTIYSLLIILFSLTELNSWRPESTIENIFQLGFPTYLSDPNFTEFSVNRKITNHKRLHFYTPFFCITNAMYRKLNRPRLCLGTRLSKFIFIVLISHPSRTSHILYKFYESFGVRF